MSETQMKRGSTAAKVGTAGAAGVALAACAACCAPLVAPLLAWFGLSSLGAAVTGWYLEIAVVSAIALVGFWLFRRHKNMNRSQYCQVDGSCGCGGNSKS
jgi:ABC-type nickel/cobalt efflux system permease component RcnA